MPRQNNAFRTLAATLAVTISTATLAPVTATSAHAQDARHWHQHPHLQHKPHLRHWHHRQVHTDYRRHDYERPRATFRHHPGHRHNKPPVVVHHHDGPDRGDVAAAAILGLIGGAIIAGAISQSQTIEPGHHHQQVYMPPVPDPDVYTFPAAPAAPIQAGSVVDQTHYAGTLDPWSAEWHSWCNSRYRSFNAQTGTYRGYDGQDHFCVAR